LSEPVQNNLRIKQKALELDFLDCGIARADSLPDDANRLRSWLDNGYHGEMDYMGNHFEKRTDPRLLVEDARSVVVVLQNYHTTEQQHDPDAPRISRYAYGKDYHKIVKKKLKVLFEWMKEEMGPVQGRFFVDSAPVMERVWAARSGLGWIGKNSLLLNRKFGSWFFLGVIISDLELETDSPMKDYCGDCTRCVDACPTSAIMPGRSIDSTRCISYLTIELKNREIPEEFKDHMNNWAFGCDICQEVCPWNNNAHPHHEECLKPRPGLLEMSRAEWQNLDEQKFNKMFEGSAVKRAQYNGLQRNINTCLDP